MKKFFGAGVVFLLLLSVCAYSFAATGSKPAVILDGTKLEAVASVEQGNICLPLRAVGEALGYEIQWSEADNTVSVSRAAQNILIDLKGGKITANDHVYYAGDCTVIEGRTYLGPDFFSENLGLKVRWDRQKGMVSLTRVQQNPITVKTVTETAAHDYLTITLQYPQIDGLPDKAVQDSINSLFRQKAMDAKQEGLNNAAEMARDRASGYTSPNGCETYFDYRLKYNQNGLLSVVCLNYQYTGGAHGLTVQSSHTFNLGTGEEYKLKDLVISEADYVARISDIVRNEIAARVKEGILPEYSITPFEAIKEDQDFYLSHDAVVVYFQQYEYFPYAAGIQEFPVEFAALKDMLKPEFLPLAEDVAAWRPGAGAELNETQQQAVDRFCQIVPELRELTLEGVHYEGDTWMVTLSDRSGDAAPGVMRTRASLSFDQDELIRFDLRKPDWVSLELPPAELAKEKANEFVRQVLGEKMKDYRMNEAIGYSGGGARDSQGNELNWAAAAVRFERLVNGIPFLNSGIRVDVDAAGRVTEYTSEAYYQMNNGTTYEEPDPALFPAPGLAMTQEKAAEVFAGQLEMKLQYIGRMPLQYQKHRTEEIATRPVLMYTPLTYAPIDALTGQPLAGEQPQQQTSKVSLAGAGKRLVAGNPEEAAALLAAAAGIDMTGMKFGGVQEDEYFTPGRKVKEYHWMSEPQRGEDGMPDHRTMRYAYLRVLADTGEVVGFNLKDEAGRGEKAVVTREAAQKTAIQFMQKYLEQGTTEMELSVYPSQEESIPAWVDRSKLEDAGRRAEFNFAFTCLHQGIPVADRAYSITVDGLTGGITAFYNGNVSASAVLPDSRQVVTADTAKAAFMQSHPLRLVYYWPEFYGQKAPRPHLVYLPDYGANIEYIDALTGNPVTVEMK